jgi:hypothetical protein
VLLVAFWVVMARHSARPFKPFDLTAADFESFNPSVPGLEVRKVPITTNDPVAPNIVVLDVRSARDEAWGHLAVRLVHGYNMPMCMKIKGYTVAPLQDSRSANAASGAGRRPVGCQVFRVTSSLGESSIWVTTMVRAGDFRPTAVDIGSMAFPRVDIPDDPRWVPRGLNLEDLRHPVVAFKRWARSRWNASRTDLWTFLRLKQPAWASEELLSFVTLSVAPAVTPATEAATVAKALALHEASLSAFRAWRQRSSP